jgi:hypothetical protein
MRQESQALQEPASFSVSLKWKKRLPKICLLLKVPDPASPERYTRKEKRNT